MAVKNYGGFGSGFAQGFGLVQNFYDAQDTKQYREQKRADDLKRDELTADYRASRLQSDADFREAEAQRRSNESLATTAYRTQELTGRLDNEARDDKRASRELDFKVSPDNPVNMRAQRELLTAQRAARLDDAFDTKINAADRVNTIYELASSGRALDQDDLANIEQLVSSNSGTLFDVNSMVDYVSQQSAQEILAYNDQLARGGQAKMSDSTIEAYSRTLGIGRTAALGRRVDASFSNAPDYMKDGNHVVSGQGLYSVDATANRAGQASVNGVLYVNVENQKTGEVYPYFPPVTSGRTPYSTEAIDLDLSKVNPAAMAGGYMSTQVGPVIKPVVRQAKILSMFGDRDKRTDGVAEFNQAVDDRLKIVRQAIQGGGNPSAYVIYMNESESNALLGKQMSEQQVAEIRSRIEDNILFGTTRTPPQQFVREWLNETSQKINKISVASLREKGFEFANSDFNDEGVEVTLGKLLNEGQGLSSEKPQQVSEYNGIASDPQALVKKLIELGHIRRSR